MTVLHGTTCKKTKKKFGKGNDNWLSFPEEGYTLALDFKVNEGLFDLLDEVLDDLEVLRVAYLGRKGGLQAFAHYFVGLCFGAT